jgi:hypothetical protein
MPQHSFKIGRKYSRTEIKDALGGSDINFLPRDGDVIVCGCFNRAYNPNAPDVILPGTGPEIEYSAKLFSKQETAVPVFIRLRPNEWEYFGDYKVERFSTDPIEIKAHHAGSITPLNEVTGVMFLTKAA